MMHLSSLFFYSVICGVTNSTKTAAVFGSKSRLGRVFAKKSLTPLHVIDGNDAERETGCGPCRAEVDGLNAAVL